MSHKRALAGLIALPLIISASATHADDIAEFYKGKTLNFIIGSAPSGGYDTYGRLVVRSMGKHIPGKPEIIPRNMPGGSSRVAAEQQSLDITPIPGEDLERIVKRLYALPAAAIARAAEVLPQEKE